MSYVLFLKIEIKLSKNIKYTLLDVVKCYTEL